jgi:hypothetical protein
VWATAGAEGWGFADLLLYVREPEVGRGSEEAGAGSSRCLAGRHDGESGECAELGLDLLVDGDGVGVDDEAGESGEVEVGTAED